MSQRDFAKLVGKPQSTISRIESGDYDVQSRTLTEIASKVNRKVLIQIVAAN
ncbi:MAG: helix-turn-helix transcriptional regulator [Lentilactobacillus diolivorans]